MSAWKIPISTEEMYFEKVFISCDILSIMRIGEEGHKTFTYACKILLQSVKRENTFFNNRANVKKVFLMVLAS